MNTAQPNHRSRQITEIRRISSRPTSGDLASQLDRRPRRHDPTVALLLMSTIVFLVVGLATMSMVSWLAGVLSLVTAFSVRTRHERVLRDLHRFSAKGHLRRDHRSHHPSRIGARLIAPRGPVRPPSIDA